MNQDAYWTNGMATLYQADARAIPLPDKSVHMCVTSPPYWGLRDYGLGQWQGGDAECGHERETVKSSTSTMTGGYANGNSSGSQQGWPNGICGHCGVVQQAAGIGLEATLGEWVANIVAVMREVKRVLRDDGTCWLNLGDAYSANRGYQVTDNKHIGVGNTGGMSTAATGLPAKNLMGQPWRVAFALQDEGWILRSAIVWHKPNPMPESVRDRPTNAYEMVFLFSKQGRYFYDAEAVREPAGDWHGGRFHRNGGHPRHYQEWRTVPVEEQTTTANARNVWTIPTQGRSDAHFATFPDELPRRCILAGTSERGACADCGAPWVRVVEAKGGTIGRSWHDHKDDLKQGQRSGGMSLGDANDGNGVYERQTLGWQPTCGCNADTVPATVLDPFAGSGTTLAVAQSLGRKSVGTDLNPEYLEIARRYIGRADGITLSLGL